MSFLESIKKEEKKNKSWLKKTAFYLFILASVTIPLFYLPMVQDIINTSKLYLLYGFSLIILFLFLLDVLVSKELIIRKTFILTPLLVFIGVGIISTIFSLIPSISLMGKTEIFVVSLASLVILVLWFWLLIQLITTTKEWQYIIDGLFISASIAGLIFLFHNISLIQLIIPTELTNVISNSNSAFGIYMAVMGVLGLGFLQIKDRPWALQILPTITGLISIVSLVQLGFQIPLIIFAIGLGLLLMIGIVMLKSSHIPVISTIFALFIGSILIIFLGVPDFATANLSSEVSINAKSSWNIVSDTVLEDIKTFLVGSGPGTFVQDFSKHRPQSFNMNSLAWTTRFERPYNTLFAIAAEFGILGLLAFVGLIFLALGGGFSGWLKTRPSVWEQAKEKIKQPQQSMKSFRMEAFVVIIGWICFTAGMFFTFYEIALWWGWFTFLGLSIVGLASL
ncbi:MAG: hypothetical protein BRC22_02580, partial [Parcubacteria group bacterium QH_9_35_7]